MSQDYQREIVRVEGCQNFAQYLNVLESVTQIGGTMVQSRNPVHSLLTVKDVIAARHMPNILWPTESFDKMPMTTIWQEFVREFNMFNHDLGNSNELWGKYNIYCISLFKMILLYRPTPDTIYLYLSKIADEYNASKDFYFHSLNTCIVDCWLMYYLLVFILVFILVVIS